MSINKNQLLRDNFDFENLSIYEGLKLEESHAIGFGNVLVKIWFESKLKACRMADLVQAFTCVSEAKKATEFLKDMNGVDACYIVRTKPKYQLIERVVCFPV